MKDLSLTDKMVLSFLCSAIGGVVAWLALVRFMVHMTTVQTKKN